MNLFVKDKKFYSTICLIAFPVVFQNLITSGVNLMDTLMLTECGELQLSASSLANQFISMFQFMCMGMGYGAAVLTAQFWGANDPLSIRKVTTLMLRVCVTLSLLFSFVTMAFPDKIMSIYTPDEEIIYQGVRYMRISGFTYLLHGLTLTLTAILRSVKEVRLPLITSIIAFFVNLFFNWMLIFGNLGAPRMEIEGAALGTLIARIVECGIIFVYFICLEKRIRYRLSDFFRSSSEYLRDYIRYCIPVLISDTLLGLGNNIISVIMGHIGASFVSAFAIVSQLTRMTTVLTQGVSNSASVITGNTLGEGNKKKAYEQGITFLTLAVILGIVVSIIIYLISPLVVYGCNLSEEAGRIAQQLLYSINITIVFSSVNSILTKGILRGGGDTRFLMVADILFLWLASVPLGYLTGLVWKCSAFVVYMALHIDWIIKAIWCSLRLIQGKWVNNAVKAVESKAA